MFLRGPTPSHLNFRCEHIAAPLEHANFCNVNPPRRHNDTPLSKLISLPLIRQTIS